MASPLLHLTTTNGNKQQILAFASNPKSYFDRNKEQIGLSSLKEDVINISAGDGPGKSSRS
jgi:hypothetical protein